MFLQLVALCTVNLQNWYSRANIAILFHIILLTKDVFIVNSQSQKTRSAVVISSHNNKHRVKDSNNYIIT